MPLGRENGGKSWQENRSVKAADIGIIGRSCMGGHRPPTTHCCPNLLSAEDYRDGECMRIALLSRGGQRHRVLCDDARGGASNEMSQNAFLTSSAQEPPPARSRLLSRSCCPPDSGGQFGLFRHLQCPAIPQIPAVSAFHRSGAPLPVRTSRIDATMELA
jgi:hypothetical protein